MTDSDLPTLDPGTGRPVMPAPIAAPIAAPLAPLVSATGVGAWWLPPPGSGDRSAVLAPTMATPGVSASPAVMSGGGNLNGTTNQALRGQAGTAGIRISMPRAKAGNYTGIV
jgi:hypothetical protein